MSKLYTAKGVTRLCIALFFIIISVVIYSCRKELIKSPQNDDALTITDPDVQAAHDWYVAAYPPVTDNTQKQSVESIGHNALLDRTKLFTPYWSRAQAFISKKGLHIVEAPALKTANVDLFANAAADPKNVRFF